MKKISIEVKCEEHNELHGLSICYACERFVKVESGEVYCK